MAEYIDRDAFVVAKRKQYCEDCERRKGMKNGKLRFCYEIGDAPCRSCGVDDMLGDIEDFPAADVRPVVICENCKHCLKLDEHESWCKVHSPMHLVRPDDWCSRGEEVDDG